MHLLPIAAYATARCAHRAGLTIHHLPPPQSQWRSAHHGVVSNAPHDGSPLPPTSNQSARPHIWYLTPQKYQPPEPTAGKYRLRPRYNTPYAPDSHHGPHVLINVSTHIAH